MAETLSSTLELWRERCILFLISILLAAFPATALVVAFHLIHGSWNWLTSVVILFYVALVLLAELRCPDRRLLLPLALLLGAAAFALFAFSAHRGIPFGMYRIADDLGMPIAGVPLAMAAGWVAVAFTTWRIADHLVPAGGIRIPVVAFMAALLAVILDIVLEPAASFVSEFWIWRHGTVPVQNYFGWFLFDYFCVLLIALVRRSTPRPVGVRRIAYAVFLMVWGMCALTGLLHGYVVETGISAAAMGIFGGLYVPWRTGTSMETGA